MATIIIDEKVVKEELGERLDKLNAQFIALVEEMVYDVYGDAEPTEEQWDKFYQDFMMAFVESVMKTIPMD